MNKEPYSTEDILRRNIASLEVALRTQTELNEKAEAELAKLALRGWEFIKSESDGRIWLHIATPNGKHHAALSAASGVESRTIAAQVIDLLCEAAPAPAPAPAPAVPAVPAEWREVMTELAADVQAACDAEHPHRDQYPSVMRKYNNDMEIVEKARALLQSAEALHD